MKSNSEICISNEQIHLWTKHKRNMFLLPKAIGKTLRDLRKTNKLSMKKCAELLTISTDQYRKYEGLTQIPVEQLDILLQYISMKEADFFSMVEMNLCTLDSNFVMNNHKQFIKSSNQVSNLYDRLHKQVFEVWHVYTTITDVILEQWIFDCGIYYPYLLLVKGCFITSINKNLIQLHHLTNVDLWFMIYYQLNDIAIAKHQPIPAYALTLELHKLTSNKQKERMQSYITSILS